jgi:hypothetical protein
MPGASVPQQAYPPPPQVTSLLPLHDRRAASSTPDSNVAIVTVPPTPDYNMPTASVPQQVNLPQTLFVPFTPNDVSRYINRPLVCVLHCNNGRS